MTTLTRASMKVGGAYNWKGQPDRLIYLGRNWSGNGYWHQFRKIGDPRPVWCEVLDSDLPMLEETTGEKIFSVDLEYAMTDDELIGGAKDTAPEGYWLQCLEAIGGEPHVRVVYQKAVPGSLPDDRITPQPAPHKRPPPMAGAKAGGGK